MALLFSDDFTGTDGADLGARASWTQIRAGGEIRGNAVNWTLSALPIYTVPTAESDVRVRAAIVEMIPATNGQMLGLVARSSGEGDQIRGGLIRVSGTYSIRLITAISGSTTTVDTVSVTAAVGDVLELTLDGDQVTLTHHPVSGSPTSIGPVTITHNQTATSHGLFGSSITNGARLDDFEVHSLEPEELTAGTLSVESIAATSVDLEITEATGGTPPYSYQLQRTGDDGGNPDDGSWTNVGSPQSETTWTDSGLDPAATTYWYRVVVEDDAEDTDTSDPVDAETPSRALVPGTAAFVASGPAVILAEETVAASDGVPSIARQWQRSEDGGSYSDLSGETAATLEDADVATGTAYRYRLKYTDQDAQVEHSNVVGPIYVYEGGAIDGGGGVFRRLAKITGA